MGRRRFRKRTSIKGDFPAGVARFRYGLGDLHFVETLAFPASGDTGAAASGAFARLLELTAVTLGVSYFKLLAPLRVEIAFPLSEQARDFVSRELFERILESEEEHIDFLETQFEMIKRMGLENYIQLQSKPAED